MASVLPRADARKIDTSSPARPSAPVAIYSPGAPRALYVVGAVCPDELANLDARELARIARIARREAA